MAKGKPASRGLASRQEDSKATPKGKSYFLGIGIDKYNDSNHFPGLNNAVRDMEKVAQVMYVSYDIDIIEMLINENATKEAIIDKFYQLAETLKPPDKLLIYFSGHGGTKSFNNSPTIGYWAVSDSKEGKLASVISNEEIKNHIRRFSARHVFLISDSCFSGSFLSSKSKNEKTENIIGVEQAKKEEQIPSRWGLCSGRHNEMVHDGRSGDHSPFARAILRVLRENDSSLINTRFFVDKAISYCFHNYQGQLAIGLPIPGCDDEGGQYIFWSNEVCKTWPPSYLSFKHEEKPQEVPLPEYQVSFSLDRDIPKITLEMLIAMEECLRKSCQLLLEKFNISSSGNQWVLRSVCESKIHAIVELLGDMDNFQEMFVKYSISSSQIYEAWKKIRQKFLDHFVREKLEFIHSVSSSDFLSAVLTPSDNADFQLSACEKIFKLAIEENENDRNELDSRIAEIAVAFKLLYLIFKNIHQATDLYDFPPHLSN